MDKNLPADKTHQLGMLRTAWPDIPHNIPIRQTGNQRMEMFLYSTVQTFRHMKSNIYIYIIVQTIQGMKQYSSPQARRMHSFLGSNKQNGQNTDATEKRKEE